MRMNVQLASIVAAVALTGAIASAQFSAD